MKNYDNSQLNIQFEPAEDKDKYPQEEIEAYIQRGREKYGNFLKGFTLKTVPEDPDSVDIYYDVKKVPFNRLRRITGYLVGDMSRWNNAKREEEHDRIKHGIE